MVKRVVVGAHYGLRDWLVQRVTAVAMAVYLLLMIGVLAAQPSLDYAAWTALFHAPLLRVATLLFFVSLLLHAWVGVRDILMDYVHPTGVRLFLQALVVLVLAAYAAWFAEILWGA